MIRPLLALFIYFTYNPSSFYCIKHLPFGFFVGLLMLTFLCFLLSFGTRLKVRYTPSILQTYYFKCLIDLSTWMIYYPAT